MGYRSRSQSQADDNSRSRSRSEANPIKEDHFGLRGAPTTSPFKTYLRKQKPELHEAQNLLKKELNRETLTIKDQQNILIDYKDWLSKQGTTHFKDTGFKRGDDS
jgi:hypothetical protein